MQEQDNQHLDSIIRSSFEKRSKAAPDMLWGALSSALDTDTTIPNEKAIPLDALDQKVKESFSSLSERAPWHVWPAINRQLNIDQVWQGISSELDKPHPLYWPAMRVAAVMLLLLLSGVATYGVFFSGTDHKQLTQISKNTPLGTAQSIQQSNLSSDPDLAAPEAKKPESIKESVTVAVEHTLPENLRSSAEISIETLESPAKSTPAAVRATEESQARAASLVSTVEATGSDSLTTSLSTGSASPDDAAIALAAVEPAMFSTNPIAAEDTAAVDKAAVDTASGVRNITGAPLAQQPIDSYPYSSKREDSSTVDQSPLPSAASIPGKTTAHNTSNSAKNTPAPPMYGAGREGGSSTQTSTQIGINTIPYDVAGIALMPEVTAGVLNVKVTPVDTLVPHNTALALLIEEETRKASRPLHFEAGPVMNYNNSWLLNNETKSSYDKNSLIATDLTYKQNWGVVLNYRLSKKSLLSSEIHLISKSGQQYKMYRDGEYMRKGLELRYYKLYLQYQRNFLEYGKHVPSRLSLQVGAYSGYLQNKRGEIRQEESRYANFDYGLKLALGQEHNVGKFILGYGISGERGLKNVFRGTELLPAEFNKTYILNVGTYINMRYAF